MALVPFGLVSGRVYQVTECCGSTLGLLVFRGLKLLRVRVVEKESVLPVSCTP